ncbi:hypothetical protein BCV72DRAFT_55930 [Rhizopus microsporus var. microsporus]|uniref:PAS domain-containing protein n=2 Tax=Rhizopus microsporus TaxID=58291 RepID=A0A2G4T5H9_RHIZD|nr:uncharacterized protein RHIMIDRAFT_246829 [Rhizopus microsporus ATCC 52813]ORE09714.1 hypothetical protein BCV72DRAFT_55930 [Rhizopus microsporus var. microsporus]PHZ16267.1 hypothetical protein RHIMIDRAFT_246829 [Rhizopus microsporus ATCC 52813]
MKNSWIVIYDNSASTTIVFVSDTITEVCGWTPEELLGQPGSELIHPEDQLNLLKMHTVNIVKERMATMVSYRFLRKDRSYITVESIINYCYNLLIVANYIYDENGLDHRMRVNTVDEVFICQPGGALKLAGAWNERKENVLRIIKTAQLWGGNMSFSSEKRFCLILNRFTDLLYIVYATDMIEELVSLPISEVVGQSIFDFVNEHDIPALKAHIDMAKEHSLVARLRFDWVIDRKSSLSEPMEGIVTSTDDGIVMVLRLSPRLIMPRSKKYC